jgi:acyl-CoA synthetase (AMP-forming)/AMP-acid ligase II
MSARAPAEDLSQLSTLAEYLDHWVAVDPGREAAVEGELRLTYAQLCESVDGCARAFLAAGVRSGDRVAMLTTPRIEFLIVFLALSRIGAVWVGLNPRHTLSELNYVLCDASCKLLIGIEHFEGRSYIEDLEALGRSDELLCEPLLIDGDGPDIEFFSHLQTRQVSDEELRAARSGLTAASPNLVVYTSGSTGTPKGALLSNYGSLGAYRRWASYMAVDQMRLLSDLPIDHVGGLDRTFLSLISGGLLVFQRRFRPDWLLAGIERERITCWMGELTQWVKCAPLLEDYDLSSLQIVGYGGGPPPLELLERFAAFVPRIFTGYGMTETSDAITLTDPGTSLRALCEHCVGRPVEGVLTRLVSPEGQAVATGEVGSLEVRSAGLFLGYLNRPEATAAAFSADGWFRTGDLLRERGDGAFDFVGRADQTYKSGGYNIYPREIEIALEAHPEVGCAAVVSVPDAVFQAVGHAFVEPAPGAAPPTSAQLLRYCTESLANYKIPKSITVLDRLPMLRSEKVDKPSLRAIAIGGGG